MKKNFVLLAALLAAFAAHAADETHITITTEVDSLGFAKAVPVLVTGYAGEVDNVLRTDLSFMGFEVVTSTDKALYTIRKNNADGVGATISELRPAYNKAFTGPSARQQTHALADDIAKTLTQKPGIAQSRIAFKGRRASYGAGEIFIGDYDGFNAQPVSTFPTNVDGSID